jgi:hypothetical protein
MYILYCVGEIQIIKYRNPSPTAGVSFLKITAVKGLLEMGVLGTVASINTRRSIIMLLILSISLYGKIVMMS